MPSVVIGQPVASGPQCVVSGNYFSGRPYPVGGVLFKMPFNASGQVYIGLSGGMTLNSGSMQLSGGISSGNLDGMPLGPGDSYFVPALAFWKQSSGLVSVYARHDAECSGITRLSFEVL